MATYLGRAGRVVWSVWKPEEGMLGPSAAHGFAFEGEGHWSLWEQATVRGAALKELVLDGEGFTTPPGPSAGG